MNGEIYNYPELRPELEALGHRFRTRTDTEVLLHLYEQYGEGMLPRLRGMFGFALWDRTRRRLLLGRDHFGQKPLFYTVTGGRLTFASEVKALLADDPSLAELSPFALDQYLTLRFVQPPETFFPRVRALPPAHYMVWEDGAPRIERYWQLAYGPKWTEGEAELLERIDGMLAEAVSAHLLSDVPVGAFLSGGLDSTLIASYAARTLGSELRTFSMGIPYRDLNELPAAAAVAARYGTRHFAEEVTPTVVHDLPRLIAALDEPADPLSMCLLHLARMTAREVKVVLGGDGGDELFGGYDRYSADRWLDLYRQRAVGPSATWSPARCSAGCRTSSPSRASPTSSAGWTRWRGRAGASATPRACSSSGSTRRTGWSCTRPSSAGSWAGARPDACVLDLFADAPAEARGGPDDVRGHRVAAAGAVAHDSRPGHDGVQPRVPLAVPRRRASRSSWRGCRSSSRCAGGSFGTWSGSWPSGICRARC